MIFAHILSNASNAFFVGILCSKSLTSCIGTPSRLVSISASSNFSAEPSISQATSEPGLMSVMSSRRGRGCEVSSIWHQHTFLPGPHKVTLNSRRHQQRLTMLRGPHLTPDPLRLLPIPVHFLHQLLHGMGADEVIFSFAVFNDHHHVLHISVHQGTISSNISCSFITASF